MGKLIKSGGSYLYNGDSFEYLGFKLKHNKAVSQLMTDKASKALRVLYLNIKDV